jgi:predicted enzyme related to lactoylglutathione lyase
MPNELAHFAINATDVARSKQFYERVFGWRFSEFGPPDFYRITYGEEDQTFRGALQQRRELLPGERTTGFECTFAVDDVDAIAAEVLAAGGRILMPKATIPGVGDLIFVADPDGNAFGAMRYDRT